MKKILVLILSILVGISSSAFALTAHFSPDKANEKVITDYVDSAEQTMDIAAYSITLPAFGEHVIAAHKRGVKVRIIWDKAQSCIKASLVKKLKRAGIPVKVVHFSGLMHNKFIIVDKRAVETGSFNFTNNATFNNNENFLIIPDADLARQYQENFDKMWSKAKP